MANPVFNNLPEFKSGGAPAQASDPRTLQAQFDAPAVDPGRMSYDGVLAKSFGLFAIVVVSAIAVGTLAPGLTIPLLIGALVMMLIAMFRKGTRSGGFYAITLAMYGGAAGGLSVMYESLYGGIILHALIATACVFAASLAVYKSGRVRNIAKVRKFIAIALPAVILFLIANIVMVMISGPEASVLEANVPGTDIPLGLLLSVFLILLGAFMLISDFDFVDTGVRSGLPKAYEWTAAFGLVFTTVWIYIQMLRLLSYLRGR